MPAALTIHPSVPRPGLEDEEGREDADHGGERQRHRRQRRGQSHILRQPKFSPLTNHEKGRQCHGSTLSVIRNKQERRPTPEARICRWSAPRSPPRRSPASRRGSARRLARHRRRRPWLPAHTSRSATSRSSLSLQGEAANKQALRRGGDESGGRRGDGRQQASGFLSVVARRALSSAVQWLLDLVLRLTRAQGLEC